VACSKPFLISLKYLKRQILSDKRKLTLHKNNTGDNSFKQRWLIPCVLLSDRLLGERHPSKECSFFSQEGIAALTYAKKNFNSKQASSFF